MRIAHIEERLRVEALAAIIMNLADGDIDSYDEIVCALAGRGS